MRTNISRERFRRLTSLVYCWRGHFQKNKNYKWLVKDIEFKGRCWKWPDEKFCLLFSVLLVIWLFSLSMFLQCSFITLILKTMLSNILDLLIVISILQTCYSKVICQIIKYPNMLPDKIFCSHQNYFYKEFIIMEKTCYNIEWKLQNMKLFMECGHKYV